VGGSRPRGQGVGLRLARLDLGRRRRGAARRGLLEPGHGVGTFILEREAARKGINYVYNTVRDTHPERDSVHDWLAVRGYQGGSSDTVLRKRVRDEDAAPAPAPARPGSPPLVARPPGHEETGGYVNVEDHQY
jgi:hypothetical protein